MILQQLATAACSKSLNQAPATSDPPTRAPTNPQSSDTPSTTPRLCASAFSQQVRTRKAHGHSKPLGTFAHEHARARYDRITAFATLETFWMLRAPPTDPARLVGPCMQQASSSTTPSSFGKPPSPTPSSSGSSSGPVTTRIAESSVSPPLAQMLVTPIEVGKPVVRAHDDGTFAPARFCLWGGVGNGHRLLLIPDHPEPQAPMRATPIAVVARKSRRKRLIRFLRTLSIRVRKLTP